MKGINFIEPLFNAVVNGTKSQTRRIMNPQPDFISDNFKFAKKNNGDIILPRYQVGETVYIAEPYFVDDEGNIRFKDGGFKRITPLSSATHYYIQKWNNNMPAKYARYFIEITAVRCERLQEISELDARAEGIKSYWLTKEGGEGADDWHESNSPPFVGAAGIFHTRREAYQELWNILNAKRGFGWESNPYVWVYDFKLTGKSFDEILEDNKDVLKRLKNK